MSHTRIEKEGRTIALMVGIYCRGNHGTKTGEPCADCAALLAYAAARLAHCPDGEGKPVCGACKRHCYKADMRGRIRAVMAYSGPRILLFHPFLALEHLVDGLRHRP